MSLGPAIDPAALFDRCIVGTKVRLPWGLLLLLLVRELRVSHAMRSAPNLQPSPVHLMSPTTLEVLSRLFVHLWHPSDPSRSQELQQNAVSSSQALELARALIPRTLPPIVLFLFMVRWQSHIPGRACAQQVSDSLAIMSLRAIRRASNCRILTDFLYHLQML